MDGSITINFSVAFKKTIYLRILSANSRQKNLSAKDELQENYSL